MESLDEVIGQYRLIRTIGRGAMGIVYQAEDGQTGRAVALKVLAADVSSEDDLVERFRREALSAAQLDHPNITRVFDFGEEGERLYMAMELLEGSDLKSLVERGGAGDLARRLSLMVQASAGIAFVHGRGLVHRDLKPANIHVGSDGWVKIMDFGLVRLEDSHMTRTGMVMGSPSYMSPEQIRGERADSRSDVFSLGITFYETLSGRRAFAAKGLTAIMMEVLNSQPPSLAECAPEVPGPVAAIVERCLRKAASERYQTGGELHAALEVAQRVYGRS